jgi:YHS domain-containing protein
MPLSTDELSRRLDAEFAAARSRISQFQGEAERSYEASRRRYRTFLAASRRIRKLVQARLVAIAPRLPLEEVRPTIYRGGRRYQGSVAARVHSDLAQIKVRITLASDSDVANLMLDYDLDVLPVYIKFAPHERLVQPVEAIDTAAIAGWLDDRLVELAHVYLEIGLDEAYQKDHLVSDPVANVRFPRHYARMQLQFEGKTYYFISDETCWEFERQHGIGAAS